MKRIYADFNDQLGEGLVHLERLGTLRDLCAARVKLSVGLPLVLYSDSTETEEIEVDATARWMMTREAREAGYWVGTPAREEGFWAGEFDLTAFRDVPKQPSRSATDWFPCWQCGTNLASDIARSGLSAESRCSHCGARVHEPIAPPPPGL